MAKKKIDEPFFLTFINLPIYEDQSDYDNYRHDYSKRRDHIKNLLKKLIKEGNLQGYAAPRFKGVIKDLEDCSDEYIKKFATIWMRIRYFIDGLIIFPNPECYKRMQYYAPNPDKKLGTHEQIFENVGPLLRWNDTSGFKMELMDELVPLKDVKDTPRIVGSVSAELVNFLLGHYRHGIFAYCGLEECGAIIITTNGRKYCCDSHRKITNMNTKKKDSEYKEYRQIRDKLRQRFNRHPHKNKMDREDFLRKNWDKGKYTLYRKFYLDRHPK